MISLWYALVSNILPFSFLDHQFMKNALLAIIFIGPIFGAIGTMVVNNRMAFLSDAIGHSTFTGLAIGTVVGLTNLTWTASLFAIVFASGITLVKHKSKSSADTIISVFSSLTIALGIAILASGGGFNKYSAFLIGDLLSITENDLRNLGLLFVVVVVFWYLFYNKIFLAGLNPSLAMARGINILLIDIIFTVLISIIVAVSIQWIGILLINSFLVLPAAAAKNLAKDIRGHHLISIGLALFSGILGLILSYYFDIATGAAIVLLLGGGFLLTLLVNLKIIKS